MSIKSNDSPASGNPDVPETPGRSGLAAFRRLWLGELLSSLGSASTAFSIGLWLFARSDATLSYAVIFFFRLAPRVVLSPFAGVVADFLPRQRTLIACSVAGAAASACLLAVVWLGHFSAGFAFCYLAVAACIDAVKTIVYGASVSDLIDKKDFVRASGYNTFYRLGESFVAPAIAIAILHVASLPVVVLIDLASFGVALIADVTTSFPARKSLPNLTFASAWRGVTHGFGAIAAHPRFLALAIIFALVNACTGSVQGVLLPLLKVLGAPERIATVNLLGGAFAFCGATYLARFGLRQADSRGIYTCFAVVAAAFVITACFTTIPTLYMLCALLGVVGPWTSAINDALWRTEYASSEIGRVIAARVVIAQVPLPFVYLGVGPMVDRVLAGLTDTAFGRSLFHGLPAARFSALFTLESVVLVLCALVPAWWFGRRPAKA